MADTTNVESHKLEDRPQDKEKSRNKNAADTTLDQLRTDLKRRRSPEKWQRKATSTIGTQFGDVPETGR